MVGKGGAYVPPHRRRSQHGLSEAPASEPESNRNSGTGTQHSVSLPCNDEKKNAVTTHRNHRDSCDRGKGSKGCRQIPDEDNADEVPLEPFLAAFTRICCINLPQREDRWINFCNRLCQSLGHNCATELIQSRKIERYSAVNGSAIMEKLKADIDNNDTGETDLPQIEWDATQNARYDKHIKPPMTKMMSPGEVGCAMSHVGLWRQLAEATQGEKDAHDAPTMLILEDDAIFYHYPKSRQRKRPPQGYQQFSKSNVGARRQQQDDYNYNSYNDRGFFDMFATFWENIPANWDLIYLGFSDRGDRLPVQRNIDSSDSINRSQESSLRRQSPSVSIFRPTYGFHTHAYAITQEAALKLLHNLPVKGPLDVWLADNEWFGMNVYCGVVDNEGWRNTGAYLVTQDRKQIKKSDIAQSGRFR